MPTCGACGFSGEGPWRFCAKCGAAMAPARRISPWPLVGLFVLGAVGSAGVYLYKNGHFNRTSPAPAVVSKPPPPPPVAPPPPPQPPPPPPPPTLTIPPVIDDPKPTSVQVEFKGMTPVFDAEVGGRKGLTLSVAFEIAGFKERQGYAIAYFSDADGTPLRDLNQAFSTSDGTVAAGTAFKPAYDRTSYTDLQIFIPYDELHLGGGAQDFQAFVRVWDASGKTWEPLADGNAQMLSVDLEPAPPSAAILGVTADHNVAQGSETGMLIHVRFQIDRHKGGKGMAVAYFATSEGTPLRDTDGAYATTAGEVASGCAFEPIYDPAEFEDLQIFMPYGQLHLEGGKLHALQFTVGVMAETGGHLSTLATSAVQPFSVDYRK